MLITQHRPLIINTSAVRKTSLPHTCEDESFDGVTYLRTRSEEEGGKKIRIKKKTQPATMFVCDAFKKKLE